MSLIMNPYSTRAARMTKLQSLLKGSILLDPLMLTCPIQPDKLQSLRDNAMLYVARAMDFRISSFDEKDFVRLCDFHSDNNKNVTPNGAVVPKKEFILEYNLFLRSWFECFKPIFAESQGFINVVRLTPNLRIKFSEENTLNRDRPLNTALPHSDAWLEGPYSYNCHVPLFGDHSGNYLRFYKPISEDQFTEDFLQNASTYGEMQWVLDYYTDASFTPVPNTINISDYALLHNTHREGNCGTRVSIDTTVVTESFPVHPDRECEYSQEIPRLGVDTFVSTSRSESDDFNEKRTVFSHYTTGAIHFNKLA